MSASTPDFADASPSGRKSADKTSNSSSNHSTHSILPSPPDSPPLRTRVPLPRQDTDIKLLIPEQRERDVEANDSYEMGPVAMSRGASTALTPMSTHMSMADSEHDPLLLRSKQLNDEEIELRRRASRRAGKSRWGIAKLGAFYTEQNEHINQLLKPLSKHAEEAQESEDAGRLPVKIAVRASLIANCCLAVLQIYAAASSLSLSFFATASDSVFDPFANIVLYRLHVKSQKADPLKYPGGGARLETIGNILYSFLMGSVSLILIVESIRALASHDPNDVDTFHIPATVAVGVAFFTKLMLFLYCYSIRGMSSQVQVLWEDHRNDLLINGFGIFTNAAGAKIAWFIDPMGAIIISCVIIASWSWTAYTEFRCLAGRSADPDFLRLVVYKAMTFSDSITAIDSCKAYHSGPDYVVEVDIVMPGDTPLWKAHDVSQDLQDQLETLPRVERAFVHVDHEVSHRPEHRKNK